MCLACGKAPVCGCRLRGDVALEPLPQLQSAVQMLVPGPVLSLPGQHQVYMANDTQWQEHWWEGQTPGDVEETDSFHGSNCKAFGTEVRGVKISQVAVVWFSTRAAAPKRSVNDVRLGRDHLGFLINGLIDELTVSFISEWNTVLVQKESNTQQHICNNVHICASRCRLQSFHLCWMCTLYCIVLSGVEKHYWQLCLFSFSFRPYMCVCTLLKVIYRYITLYNI